MGYIATNGMKSGTEQDTEEEAASDFFDTYTSETKVYVGFMFSPGKTGGSQVRIFPDSPIYTKASDGTISKVTR